MPVRTSVELTYDFKKTAAIAALLSGPELFATLMELAHLLEGVSQELSGDAPSDRKRIADALRMFCESEQRFFSWKEPKA